MLQMNAISELGEYIISLLYLLCMGCYIQQFWFLQKTRNNFSVFSAW